MEKLMKSALLADIISGLFILLFVYAACSKLMDYDKFRVELGKSPLLSPFAQPTAWLIPSLEITISLLLVFERTRFVALYTSFCLMVIFSAYIIVILNFSEYIPCSCGGILEKMGWKQHFWFNISFVAMGAAAVLFYPNQTKKIIAR
jgi:uncharacterized membrane protein YphA (DoxX/SURF4 family)